MNGAPAGYIALHTPDLTDSVDAYTNHLESDSYLLPQHRGQRMMSQAWKQLLTQLPPGTRIVAEIYETNTSLLRRVERDGWQHEGRFYWRSATNPADSGWCRRYTYVAEG